MAKTPNKRRGKHLGSEALAAAIAQCDVVRKRIVQERMHRGLIAEVMAKRIGISRSFYSQLENGNRRIDLVYFLAICRALRVEPGELLK